ncbi:polymerase delta-interacting protein 3 [Microcaecilia unicolor]|uniref:Polymerase delta-interacting protein 3 n=1 Tax=Microcaecilia unicolor TaxID=1415580 RepID=A0A6P7Y5W9_9AMPH|nr:polymerase delta-interacting protein 3 [Microcaecilia unicolor]
MADLSLDELIRKRGVAMKGRLNIRPGLGDVRSRIGLPQPIVNRPAPTFQRTFDARQKIGITDARQKLGIKDAREKLLQKDARFRIKGKVQDARDMLNSRKQQSEASEKMIDAREKISLKRSLPVAAASPIAVSTPAMKITKTIQIPQVALLKSTAPGLSRPSTGMRINVINNHTQHEVEEEEEEDDYEETVSPIPTKPLKITATNSLLQNRPGMSGSRFSIAKTVPLTKVVQNDTYMAPAPPLPSPRPLSPIRSKALTNMSRTLVTKEEPAVPQPMPTEPAYSPLEGTKMTVNNLHPRVTEEDIVELFCVCGALKRARLIQPGVAEVVFVKKEDAISAYKKYNNRCLDGQPMKCNLHMNGNVITSDQPILLRLSDTPASVKKTGEARRSSLGLASNPQAEVDPATILQALFKSSGASASVQPTAFQIKL